MSLPSTGGSGPSRWSPARRVLLLGGGLLALLLLAHVHHLSRFLEGTAWPGCRAEKDGCDILYALRFAWSTQQWCERFLGGVDGPLGLVSFAVRDFWRIAVHARVYNLLDLVGLVIPLRLLLPVGPALLCLRLLVLLSAGLGGALLAWERGAGPATTAGAALTASTAGVVLTTLEHGHFPQALLVLPLVLLVGMERLWRGAPWGVTAVVMGAVLCCLAYWQFALMLGVGFLFWMVLRRMGGGAPAPGFHRRLLLAIALITLLLVAPATAMLEALRTGAEWRTATVPWGTPFPAPGTAEWDPSGLAALTLLDSLSWNELLSPASGWLLPPLPLLLPWALGWRKREMAAAGLVVLAVVLVVGPLPVWPSWLGGEELPLSGNRPRLGNPLYLLFYRWLPTFARMHHPLRWGVLLALGSTVLVIVGLDRIERRHRRLAAALVLGGGCWAACVGPWIPQAAPFPGRAETLLDPCRSLLVSPEAWHGPTHTVRSSLHLLEGVAWKPVLPPYRDPDGGLPVPTPELSAAGGEQIRALERWLEGRTTTEHGASSFPPVLQGTCLVLDPELDAAVIQRARALLPPQHRRPPRTLPLEAGALPGLHAARDLAVVRFDNP